jgi:tetratricopeptide (TPR) repeat protein
LDFASDAKNTKLTARDMMKMVSKLNDSYLSNLPTKSDAPLVEVECYTCHRGQPKPKLLQNVLRSELETGGMKGLDSTYRDLRDKYYGSGTFNFSAQTLAYLALDVADQSPDNALAILKLNSEFNPKSLINEWATGRVYIDQADTANAIAAFERALQIDPNNRRIAHDLQMLRGGRGPETH